ncbi:hypothetical protein SGO26_09280 [Cupriavidus metallidurans]|uniref:hypothetical protein n=1 Tax=Cupriavidus TaxID=106589 RepID=UPI0025A72090|nr:hypothetical protein [Cupriavidus sp. TKC]GMG90243.1 hypothetical protein Cmtc_14630 [Cupriavidus sp. TKC]
MKTLRIVFFVVVVALAVSLCGAGFHYGQRIEFAQQWPLYEALRNTASIIFAVVGAWLAIIYPERLKLSFGKSDGKAAPKGNIGLLLTPAVHSTIILVILLLVGIVAPLLKQIPAIAEHVEVWRGVSFALLTSLTLWQVVIVIMTIFPADMVQTFVAKEEATAEIKAHYGKLNRKADPKKVGNP